MSGFLSYNNYIAKTCFNESWLRCGGLSGPVEIFGEPTCIYGLVMFVAAFILAIWAMLKPSTAVNKTLFVVALVGTLFSASLVVYEAFWLNIFELGVPACLYGFIFYGGALWTTIPLIRRQNTQLPPINPAPSV